MVLFDANYLPKSLCTMALPISEMAESWFHQLKTSQAAQGSISKLLSDMLIAVLLTKMSWVLVAHTCNPSYLRN
jgi:succinate dehydrogenase/fumarate reductase cytochrome b subunit